MESVDIIASGYEWDCPKCGAMNTEIEVSKEVICLNCARRFNTSPPEHIYGK